MNESSDQNHPTLSSSQRKQLRGLAHHLQPVVHIGERGLADTVMLELDEALQRHELIKIRFVDFLDEKKRLLGEIEERLAARSAGTVGHVAILYRRHPDPEQRRIRLKG
ncbi:MAG: YhbY family RNA-binding protein [Acidobacteriota bacterium]